MVSLSAPARSGVGMRSTFSLTVLCSLLLILLSLRLSLASSVCNNLDASETGTATPPLFDSTTVKFSKPSISTSPLAPPVRILMGPGPSTPHPRVLAAASLPMVGHMHPEFIAIMDDVKTWLRYAFQTKNEYTIAVSGTGHAAMEASVSAVVEPGDVVIVGVNGIWGERMCELAARFGADVRRLETAPGTVFTAEQVGAALKNNPGTAVLFLVHGESSTGTLQPLEGIGALCKQHGALLFVDAVCTLGGVPLGVDQQGVDVIYSGSQKCLGAPVAPSPLSLSPSAREKLANRTSPMQSYYFDMNLVGEYWNVDQGVPRKYHHTGMVSNVYALREALALLAEEGLEATWARHLATAEQLWAGIEALGLEFFVPRPEDRLPTVTTIKVPENVDAVAVIKYMMGKYNVEIAGGLGPTVGKVWRIGVMGFNAQPAKVALLLYALGDALKHATTKSNYQSQ
eukprot:TRINITY_DN20941_c0_g1_i1.p1 TRINITY_DN20941_c0_g1~~TRINITY_DN20941_c0_g1_i1.p1  ORF type:complete len:456 (+),score=37.97 TRINITY_DN20941_c0_g1_i1:141-1508(+)